MEMYGVVPQTKRGNCTKVDSQNLGQRMTVITRFVVLFYYSLTICHLISKHCNSVLGDFEHLVWLESSFKALFIGTIYISK